MLKESTHELTPQKPKPNRDDMAISVTEFGDEDKKHHTPTINVIRNDDDDSDWSRQDDSYD